MLWKDGASLNLIQEDTDMIPHHLISAKALIVGALASMLQDPSESLLLQAASNLVAKLNAKVFVHENSFKLHTHLHYSESIRNRPRIGI